MTHNPVSDSLSEPLLQGGEEPQLGHTVVQVSATAATSNGTAHPTGTIQKTLQRKGSGDSDGRQAESLSVSVRRCSTLQTTAALLTLQLGWGLWLLPCDFARLGWVFGIGELVAWRVGGAGGLAAEADRWCSTRVCMRAERV